MNRKETTLFLSHILERTKLNVFGKHYAKEEIMPCVQDENVQSPVTAEECNKCMKEWLEKRSGN